jgi:hypothetical protein
LRSDQTLFLTSKAEGILCKEDQIFGIEIANESADASSSDVTDNSPIPLNIADTFSYDPNYPYNLPLADSVSEENPEAGLSS